MYPGSGSVGDGELGPKVWSAGDALPSHERHESETPISIAGTVEGDGAEYTRFEGVVVSVVDLDIGPKFDAVTVEVRFSNTLDQ